jgi:hypothetical protein
MKKRVQIRISFASFAPWREIVLCVALMLLATSAARAADLPSTQPASAAIDDPMWLDPLLPAVPRVTDFDPRDKTLWLEALARPEADMRRQAADTFALAASQGMSDLGDATAKIAATLDSDTHPIVRQSCAQALFHLGAKQFAAVLLKHAGDDWQTMLIADAALSAWDYAPAHAAWRARLTDPQASELAVRSALKALGGCATHEPADIPPIQAIAIDIARSPAVRLDAATQLGAIASTGLEPAAQRLAKSAILTDRLVAATMLGSSSSPAARQVLLTLADDREPLVIAAASRRLLAIDPKSLAGLDGKLMASDDFAVRRVMVDVLWAQRSPEAVAMLAKMMNDPSKEIRVRARDALLRLSADPSLAGAVSDGAVAAVSGGPDEWRGIEQALLLLGASDNRHADARIVELLSDDGPHGGALRIAAVVAVRRLRIESAMPALARRCAAIQSMLKEQQAAMMKDPKKAMSDAEFISIGEEGSQIAQALGLMDYHPADAALRGLVPKDSSFPVPMRVAAIWALGRLHAGTPDNGLVGELMARATDRSMFRPEAPEVQTMAIEAIGMMRSKQVVRQLRKLLDQNPPEQFAAACRWALAQITGQSLPPPAPDHIQARGFFLEAEH